MPNMRVCRQTGALIFSPTKEELSIQNLKKDLQSSLDEVNKELKELKELKKQLTDK